jgi:transcription-repair coupling factor (superfamily II helicase)
VNIQDLTRIYQQDAGIQAFGQQLLASGKLRYRLEGLSGSLDALVMAALYQNLKRNFLIIAKDKEEALYFMNDLQTFLPRKDILFFPASYKRPYQMEEIDNANVLMRAETLNELNHTRSGNIIVVTFPEALSEKVINKKSLVKNTLDIRKGDKIDMRFVADMLDSYGFESCDFVMEAGQYAVRGGILDVYSFSQELPYRIEFDDDLVESVRTFDPVDQLSREDVGHLSLIPNIRTRLLEDDRVSMLEYISPATYIWIKETELCRDELNHQYERAETHYAAIQSKSGNASPVSEPAHLYLNGTAFLQQAEAFKVIEFGSRPFYKQPEVLRFRTSAQPAFHKDFNLLAQHLQKQQEGGIQNLIFSENEKQLQRLHEIFAEVNASVQFHGLTAELHAGFIDHERHLACFTDHQIFERYHRYKVKASYTRSKALTLKELRELKPGDFVTHIHHGIGKFAGLETIKVGSGQQEAVKIVYQGGDSIYVNISALYKISKFSGSEGAAPKLNKLGSPEWNKAKAKAKKKVRELAFDLISLYAKRKSQPGIRYTQDSYLQQELEASFIYEDTPDQLKTTEAVKADMEEPHPMDRLVCGDVGFGKTEIAIRAAFKAATDGKQVAVLVPTTILGMQHLRTFRDRLRNFPVRVEYLSRFTTAKEQKELLAELAQGKIDILIGTHKLLSSAVKFKDLGLMIIDEEQKFGVAAKEKLKLFKVNVDTLTLTATPIPRTLQFSLMGVRDMSIITTPPPNRQPVQTRLHTFEAEVIRDSIAYELKRGGQVFFIHNRIQDLEDIAAMIKKLVPDARIAVGHGRMSGADMENMMVNFIEGAHDVLVSTTIVESGLDIPNANTIIINNGHMFGLSDLHQMRGRVGRSNRQAFCYILSPPLTMLTSDARKRLSAIEEFSDLGAGIHVAMRDLDIRGAGNILGGEQSGFISEIGYEMYHRILDEAVMELKEEFFPELFAEEIKKRKEALSDDCQIDTDQNVMIPSEYIGSVAERLSFYNRIAALTQEADIRTISREMIDRFGPIPEQVLALFDIIRIRETGKRMGFERIVLKEGRLKVYFISNPHSQFYKSEILDGIIQYVQKHPALCRMKQSEKGLMLTLDGVFDVKQALYRVQDIFRLAVPVLENSQTEK